MVVGGCGVPVVGVNDDGGVVLLSAVPARQLTLENILGSRSTWHGENAVVHRCSIASTILGWAALSEAAEMMEQLSSKSRDLDEMLCCQYYVQC